MESLDRIDALLKQLEEDLGLFADLVQKKTEAESEYRSAKARAWMEARVDKDLKTVGDKEAYIDNKLSKEFFEFKLSEGKLDAHKERIRTLRAMLSALQTLSSAGRV